MDTQSRSPSISIASYPTSPDPVPLAAEHPPVHRPYRRPPAPSIPLLNRRRPPAPLPYSTAAADPPHPAHRLIKKISIKQLFKCYCLIKKYYCYYLNKFEHI